MDYYEGLQKLYAKFAKMNWKQQVYRAIVTYRAKKPDKLKEKLIKRNEKHKYKDIEEIYEDIVRLGRSQN